MFQNIKSFTLNFGPHHPSTHGVLRLILELAGERVISCDPDIGYLHRGVEKLVEKKRFISIIPFIDRLDYISSAIQEHAYVLALEKVLNINVPERAMFIRTIFDELTRISSHIIAIGTSTFDLGCLSLFLYGIEEREKIMDIFEEVAGARLHLAYYIPGGVLNDVTKDVFLKIRKFLDNIGLFLKAVEKMALNNRIFMKRTKDIGLITKDEAMASGISGVNLRASGVDYDVRKVTEYSVYGKLDFSSIILDDGDCYSRIKLRFLEIEQSVSLIRQCLSLIKPGNFCIMKPSEFCRLNLPTDTIIYSATESPRGEFGIHMIVQDDSFKPHRMHFKSPSFAHIQLLKKILVGHRIADVTAILGSLDFIMGCCDR